MVLVLPWQQLYKGSVSQLFFKRVLLVFNHLQVHFDPPPVFVSLPYSSTGVGGRRWRLGVAVTAELTGKGVPYTRKIFTDNQCENCSISITIVRSLTSYEWLAQVWHHTIPATSGKPYHVTCTCMLSIVECMVWLPHEILQQLQQCYNTKIRTMQKYLSTSSMCLL